MSRNGRSPSDIFLLGNRRLTNDLDLAFSRRQTAIPYGFTLKVVFALL